MGKFFYYEDIKNVNFDLILEIFVTDIYICIFFSLIEKFRRRLEESFKLTIYNN